jgi:hypothetical protein
MRGALRHSSFSDEKRIRLRQSSKFLKLLLTQRLREPHGKRRLVRPVFFAVLVFPENTFGHPVKKSARRQMITDLERVRMNQKVVQIGPRD